jgi:hypothetical protein
MKHEETNRFTSYCIQTLRSFDYVCANNDEILVFRCLVYDVQVPPVHVCTLLSVGTIDTISWPGFVLFLVESHLLKLSEEKKK